MNGSGRSFRQWAITCFRPAWGHAYPGPDDATQPLDSFELNLFAAKPDRVSDLSQRGFWWTQFRLGAWRERLQGRGCVLAEPAVCGASRYERAGRACPRIPIIATVLAAYATWRAADQPLAIRCAALAFAVRGLRSAWTPDATRGVYRRWRVLRGNGARAAKARPVLNRLSACCKAAKSNSASRSGRQACATNALRWGNRPGRLVCRATAEQFERALVFRP